MQLSVGQAMELQHAFARGAWTPEYVKSACEGDVLSRHALDLLRGDVEIVRVKRVIDCDVDPELPEGHRMVKHDRLGLIEMDKLTLDLVWPSNRKMSRDEMTLDREHMMPKYLVGKSVPNKNLRDYLLRHLHLIPDWYNIILFWGSVLNDGLNSIEYVPGMTRNYGEWRAYDQIVHKNDENYPYTYKNSAAIIV